MTKLMKKLKVTTTLEKDAEDEEAEDVGESWEDLASDEVRQITLTLRGLVDIKIYIKIQKSLDTIHPTLHPPIQKQNYGKSQK